MEHNFLKCVGFNKFCQIKVCIAIAVFNHFFELKLNEKNKKGFFLNIIYFFESIICVPIQETQLKCIADETRNNALKPASTNDLK